MFFDDDDDDDDDDLFVSVWQNLGMKRLMLRCQSKKESRKLYFQEKLYRHVILDIGFI